MTNERLHLISLLLAMNTEYYLNDEVSALAASPIILICGCLWRCTVHHSGQQSVRQGMWNLLGSHPYDTWLRFQTGLPTDG